MKTNFAYKLFLLSVSLILVMSDPRNKAVELELFLPQNPSLVTQSQILIMFAAGGNWFKELIGPYLDVHKISLSVYQYPDWSYTYDTITEKLDCYLRYRTEDLKEADLRMENLYGFVFETEPQILSSRLYESLVACAEENHFRIRDLSADKIAIVVVDNMPSLIDNYMLIPPEGRARTNFTKVHEALVGTALSELHFITHQNYHLLNRDVARISARIPYTVHTYDFEKLELMGKIAEIITTFTKHIPSPNVNPDITGSLVKRSNGASLI